MDHPDQLIKDLTFAMIMALEKEYEPLDVIGGICDALDDYEKLIVTSNNLR